ncbi:MAG: hypothetical protein NWE93_10315 [Candidatus Bathyarchaeota archaeon]|nr:hypothetical protein [Candidatus Bathyarchaeota archaeon]
MGRKIFVTLLSLIVLLVPSIALMEDSVSAQTSRLIHVEATYTNPFPPQSNIVTNGDFEAAPATNTLGNWQVIASDLNHKGTIAQTKDAHAGSYSGAFTATANPSGGGFVALSESTLYWAIGQTYTLTFYYKSNLSSCYAEVFCKSTQATAGNDLASWSSSLAPTNVWTSATLTFGPIPDGTVDVQIHFGPPTGITGTLLIDDVSTGFSTKPQSSTAPSPAPTANPTQNSAVNPTPDSSTAATSSTGPAASTTSGPKVTGDPTGNPAYSDQPAVPELTPLAIISALLAVTVLAAISRMKRNRSTPLKVSIAAGLLIAVLLFPAVAYQTVGQETLVASAAPTVAYSLWFTNGTAFPTGGANSNGYVIGGPFLNVGGIHAIASGYGSSADKTCSIVVLRNDGDVPINVALTLRNAKAPSNIQIQMHYFFLNNQTYQPYSNEWMGKGNVGQNPLAPGQVMWLAITVSLGQTNVPLTGTPNYDFSYSFDIEVAAAQA